MFVKVNGQATWQKGFIVRSGQDTVRGWIKYNKNRRFPPLPLLFSKDPLHHDVKMYEISELFYFEVTGVDAFTHIWMNYDKPGEAWSPSCNCTVNAGKFHNEWARILVKGVPLTLYELDDGARTYFITVDTSRMIQLVDISQPKEYTDPNDTVVNWNRPPVNWNFQAECMVYQVQLEELTAKYKIQHLNVAIDVASYHRQDIKSIVISFNEACGHNTFIQNSDNDKTIFYIGGGLTSGIARFQPVQISHLPVFNFQRSASPFISVGADFYHAHWIYRHELSYCDQYYSAIEKENSGGSDASFIVNLYNLNYATSLLYSTDHYKKYRLYGGAGLFINYTLSRKAAFYNAPSYLSSDIDSYKAFIIPSMKLGISLKNKLDISLNYRWTEKYQVATDAQLLTNVFSMSVDFYFKKVNYSL